MQRKIQTRTPICDEIPSVLLLIFSYGAYAALTASTGALGNGLAILLLALTVAMHSSLQHEFLHGHPTANQTVNDLLVSMPIGLFVPYLRFKDTHLAHHNDPTLTDPYDDPESNFLSPDRWARLPAWLKSLRNFNNTLFGRMLVGPVVSLTSLYASDLAAARAGDRRIAWAYGQHALGLAVIAFWQATGSQMPVWAVVLAAYLGMSILKIRTFLEHRAHEAARARSVVIEDRGPLAILFLNNNFHAVHHANPGLVWHRIPQEYAHRRDEVLRRNGGYWYRSYWSVFQLYLFRRKDPVPHPLRAGQRSAERADSVARDSGANSR